MAALRVLWCGDTAPLGLADAVAVPVVAVGWSFQEWAIHKYLLHGLEVCTSVRRLRGTTPRNIRGNYCRSDFGYELHR